MPKRKPAKRPVGRPRKTKLQPKVEGEVFEVDYGAYRLNLQTEIDGDLIRNVDGAFEYLMQYLIASQQQVDATIHRLAEDMTTSQVLRSELQEYSIMAELLRRLFEESLRKGLDTGDLREARAIALGFTVGQLSVIAPQREHEGVYAMGHKIAKSAKQGGQVRKIDRPNKTKLQSELRQQIAKHGKKTLAVAAIAKQYSVSANTVRAWVRELSITLK